MSPDIRLLPVAILHHPCLSGVTFEWSITPEDAELDLLRPARLTKTSTLIPSSRFVGSLLHDHPPKLPEKRVDVH